mmetsp:Transcript_58813/g.81594  ORF Transcript_58813/g.81594 Transcript_58813/m.81594 type:complete len:357 (+) Transcript_58813:122-1192(+)
MGCGSSSPEIQQQVNTSKNIDRDIKRAQKTAGSEVKILLLGAGASGKSTIAKQMKLLYLDGFSEKEASIFTEIIFFNIIKNMKTLVVQADKFGYELEDKNKLAAEELKNMTIQLSDVELTTERGQGIAALWNDAGIQQTVDRCNEFQLDDSAPYFFQNLERIAKENYKPSTQDILNVRAKTTGIVETEFIHNGLHFRMVDVGGQRNERKKWIHCFQDVTAIIFVVAVSEYDLKLEEDLVTNRMSESLKLFNDVVNNRWFSTTNVILFLNKKDLFAKKIKKIPLTICFPEYTGTNEYAEAMEYVLEKFTETNKSEEQQRFIYHHETCATDTNNIKVVFEAVADIFLTNNLRVAGFSN